MYTHVSSTDYFGNKDAFKKVNPDISTYYNYTAIKSIKTYNQQQRVIVYV